MDSFQSDLMMHMEFPSSDFGGISFGLPSIESLADPVSNYMDVERMASPTRVMSDEGSVTSSPLSLALDMPKPQHLDWNMAPSIGSLPEYDVSQPQPVAVAPPRKTKAVKPPARKVIRTEEKKARGSTKKLTGRKRKRGKLDKEALALRRKRHNEVEIRRRKKIADSFAELRDITGCAQANKGSILKCAIEQVGSMKEKIRTLQSQHTSAPAPAYSFHNNESPVATVTCNNAGCIIDCNSSFLRVVGLSSKQELALGGGLLHRFTNVVTPAVHALQQRACSADFYEHFPTQLNGNVRHRGTAFRTSPTTINVIIVPMDNSYTACGPAPVEAFDASSISGSLSAMSSSPRSTMDDTD